MTYYPTGITVVDTSTLTKPIVTLPPKPPRPKTKTIRYPSSFGRRGAQRSLGACCASCAEQSLGQTSFTLRTDAGSRAVPQQATAAIAAPGGGAGVIVKLALLAGLATGGYFLVKKLRAKKA